MTLNLRFRIICAEAIIGWPVGRNTNPTSCVPVEKRVNAQMLDSEARADPLTERSALVTGSPMAHGRHPAVPAFRGHRLERHSDLDLGGLRRLEPRHHRHLFLHYYQALHRTRLLELSKRSWPAIGGVPQNGVASIPSGQPGRPPYMI